MIPARRPKGDPQKQWGDALDRWKATHASSGTGIVHLIDASYSLRAVLACWPAAPVTWVFRGIDPSDAWAPVRIDFNDLAQRSGLNARAALAAFERLRALGAINPDRSVHAEAADYMRKHAELKAYPMKITARIDLGELGGHDGDDGEGARA